MVETIKRILSFIGVDKAILYTSSAKIIQGFGGVISLFFIALHLTGIEQGFYFTFSSLLAIQVFFELGLSEIITQFVAHEASNINLLDIEGQAENKHLSRLSSLLHFCLKWYSRIAFLLFFSLVIIGSLYFTFFYKSDDKVDWILPWITISLGTSIYLIISPVLAFLEGLGKIKEIAKIRVIQQLISMLSLWICLWLGAKLYSGGVTMIIGIITMYMLVYKKHFHLLKKIWQIKINERVSYRLEIFPYQWRIAISWISGYFIFQLFNPVLFATVGPIAAGQMGLTLTALNAIMGLTFGWYSTKVPIFSGFIAQKKYYELDNVFVKVQKQSTIICTILLILTGTTIYILQKYNIIISNKRLGDRFLPILPTILMMITIVLRQIYGGWATYIRCHKTEPFLVQSVVTALLNVLSLLVLSKLYGTNGITMGYLILNVISFYWTYRIYKTKKIKLHGL